MRVVSETRYYKTLAKLYEKCASLSRQLDIYEFDLPQQSSNESNSEYLLNIKEEEQQPTKKCKKKIVKKKKTKSKSQ